LFLMALRRSRTEFPLYFLWVRRLSVTDLSSREYQSFPTISAAPTSRVIKAGCCEVVSALAKKSNPEYQPLVSLYYSELTIRSVTEKSKAFLCSPKVRVCQTFRCFRPVLSADLTDVIKGLTWKPDPVKPISSQYPRSVHHLRDAHPPSSPY
jgi:hypothetical protein